MIAAQHAPEAPARPARRPLSPCGPRRRLWPRPRKHAKATATCCAPNGFPPMARPSPKKCGGASFLGHLSILTLKGSDPRPPAPGAAGARAERAPGQTPRSLRPGDGASGKVAGARRGRGAGAGTRVREETQAGDPGEPRARGRPGGGAGEAGHSSSADLTREKQRPARPRRWWGSRAPRWPPCGIAPSAFEHKAALPGGSLSVINIFPALFTI